MGNCGSKNGSAATSAPQGPTQSIYDKPPPKPKNENVNEVSVIKNEKSLTPPAEEEPENSSIIRKPQSRKDVTPSIREQLINIHGKAHQVAAERNNDNAIGSIPEEENMEVSKKDGDKGDRDARASQKKNKVPDRLQNIFATPLDIQADYIAPKHPKSDSAKEFIDNALSGNFIFASLDGSERSKLIDAFEPHNVSESDNIITQGETGDYFYILESGTVKFEVNGVNVGTATAGQSFGELALLYNCPRAATCIAEGDCTLWKVDQKTFRQILASQQIVNDNEVKDILRTVPFLAELDDKFLHRITDALTNVNFKMGQTIIRKGDVGNVFYIVREGRVKVHDIGIGESKYEDQILVRGGYFGERAIVTSEPRVANVTAETDAVMMCLSREVFTQCLGDLGDVIAKSEDKRTLMAMPLFKDSHLQKYEIDTLSSLIDDVPYTSGHVFYTQGSKVIEPALYIVREGKINIDCNGTIINLTKGGFFGDDTFQPGSAQTSSVIAKATARVEEDCVVGVLSKYAILSVIGDIHRLTKKEEEPPEEQKVAATDDTSGGEAPVPNRRRNRRNDLSSSLSCSLTKEKIASAPLYSDLAKHRILGVGTFGQVWLVSNKREPARNTINSKQRTITYALKIQNKRELINHRQVDGVIRERNVMASIEHPFIIQLVQCYQDKTDIYMLLALVQGGELFTVLHSDRHDGVLESSARFYAACILEGLSYMHKRSILYRDLKPENVLMDQDGYTVIVDLGFAKVVPDKTYTLCGTPLYLAPEVILSRGHDKGADHWSLGVLIFEMISGVTPFYEDGIDQIGLFKKIVQGKFNFPPDAFMPHSRRMTTQVKDLIRRILVVRPIERLGSLAGGDHDIKGHSWFKSEDMEGGGIDFGDLLQKKITAPWIPKIGDALDSRNFDDWSHEERKGPKGGAPLNAREQILFEDFGDSI